MPKRQNHNDKAEDNMPDDNPGVVKTITDDIIGVKDWRRSKIDFVLGVGALFRASKQTYKSIYSSFTRLRSLIEIILPTEDNRPTLPLEYKELDSFNRFHEAMKINFVTDSKLRLFVKNSYRNFYLFLFVTFLLLIGTVFSYYMWPPNSIYYAIVRIGPIPLSFTLLLRQAYANWLFRNKTLSTLGDFVRSGDWFPKEK